VTRFIGYPNRQVVAVFDDRASADRAVAALRGSGVPDADLETYDGVADAVRFDATGELHGIVARLRRLMQFSLMDQLPAMAWYEAALREGKVVLAVRTVSRPDTLRVVEVLKKANAHFINRFGRFATEEFVRWRGPEPAVTDLMRH
jgi:hypothetical protein